MNYKYYWIYIGITFLLIGLRYDAAARIDANPVLPFAVQEMQQLKLKLYDRLNQKSAIFKQKNLQKKELNLRVNAVEDLPVRAVLFTDDFETNKGWIANPNGTDDITAVTAGQWERGNPTGTAHQNDITRSGSNALVTGAANTSDGSHDVDGGLTSIRSPAITIPANTEQTTLDFYSYLSHDNRVEVSDFLRVSVIGTTTREVLNQQATSFSILGTYQQYTYDISAFAGQTIRILIEASSTSASFMEASVDDVTITTSAATDNGNLICSSGNDEIRGKVFKDANFNGLSDPTETTGFSGVIVTATNLTGTTKTATTNSSGIYTLTGLVTGSTYRIEFSNFPTDVIPTLAGIDNGTTVQFVQSGSCANLGALSRYAPCNYNSEGTAIGAAGEWVYIGNPNNPVDGSSYSTVVNGSTITHSNVNQVGRGSISYGYWMMDRYVRVRDFLKFLNAVDPTNSSEPWEGGLVGDNTIAYNVSLPVGSRWYALARNNVCSQTMTAAQVENMVVDYVSFKVAARYANWIATGNINQGAYTFSNTTSATANITARNINYTSVRLPEEDELYKALYWNQGSNSYNLHGTTAFNASGVPTISNVTSAGVYTVPSANLYNNTQNCFKLIYSGQGAKTPYGLYFGMGDFHDMAVPYNTAFPMSTNVVRPDNQLKVESAMRSSFRLDTELSYNDGFPSPSFRFVSKGNPCSRTPGIGNRVWRDTDADGIQDADEPALVGVTIQLIKGGTVIATTKTNSKGEYYFSRKAAQNINLSWTGTDAGVLANTSYTVRIANAKGASRQAVLNDLFLTTANANSNNSDNIDSDAVLSGDNAQITLTTGNDGVVNYSYDFGFIPCLADAGDLATNPNITNFAVCQGLDLVNGSGTSVAFIANYAAADETQPNATNYNYQYLLTNSAGTILQSGTSGDFDFSNLSTGTYNIYGLSYGTFNSPAAASAYLNGITGDGNSNDIAQIETDEGGEVYCLALDSLNMAGSQVQVVVNPLPTLTVTNTQCAFNFQTYNIDVTSDADDLTSTAGTVTNNNNGTFTVSAIPANTDVTLTAVLNATACEREQSVTAPSCTCPNVNPPANPNNPEICDGEATPALTVTVGGTETVDWYSTSSGGTALATGTPSYTPAGSFGVGTTTYYAETRNILSTCTSSTRTPVTLTINANPTAAPSANEPCAGETLNILANAASGDGSYTYNWTGPNGFTSTQPNPTINGATYIASGIYYLTVTDGNLCEVEGQVNVLVRRDVCLPVDVTIKRAGE